MDLFLTFILVVALVSAQGPANDELQMLNKRSSDDSRLQTLEGQYAIISADLSAVQDSNAGAITSVDSLQEKVATMEYAAQSRKISFTAKAVTKVNFSAGSAIEFDTIHHETGGSNYNPSNGKFACRISGVYAFSATLINGALNRKFKAYFMLDNVIQARLYGLVHDDNKYETAAGTITIRCSPGQFVYLKTENSFSMSGESYCFFSGFFLFD